MKYFKNLSKRKVSDDPMVKRISELIGAEPTAEAVSGGFDAGAAKVLGQVKDINMARMGQSVSSAVSSLGEALGVKGAGDIGAEAGTTSGVGPDGRDFFSESLAAGIGASFGTAKAASLRERADRLMQLGLTRGEAEKAAKSGKDEALMQLATLHGQAQAATPDPIETAMKFLQFGSAFRGYNSGGSGGSGGQSTTGTTNWEKMFKDLIKEQKRNKFLAGAKGSEVYRIPGTNQR
jgi:hypothetical protein